MEKSANKKISIVETINNVFKSNDEEVKNYIEGLKNGEPIEISMELNEKTEENKLKNTTVAIGVYLDENYSIVDSKINISTQANITEYEKVDSDIKKVIRSISPDYKLTSTLIEYDSVFKIELNQITINNIKDKKEYENIIDKILNSNIDIKYLYLFF
ncbi:MAG: hypothetical protein ACP5UN_03585 [Candidatus Micrarchaeia archaeon]